MRLSTCVKRACQTVILSLIAVIFIGCLNAEENILGRYDAAKDEFVFLNMYQRISAEKTEDLTYLYNLWRNRDNLVTPPIPNILGKSSFLRLSTTQFAPINLGSAPSSIEPEPAVVPLEAITVKPGTFFLRGPQALCYYDQIVVPGKFVDQFLEAMLPQMRTSLIDHIEKEVARRKQGGKVFTFEQATKSLIKEMHGEQANSPDKPAEEKPENISQVLSMESLDLLTKSLKDGTATVSRKGPIFTATVPASALDIQAVLKLIKDLRAEADRLSQEQTDQGKTTAALKKLTDVIEAKAASPTLLEVRIDAVKFFGAMDAIQNPAADLTPVDADVSKRTAEAVAAMRGKNVPIDDKLTVDQILKDFRAGALRAHPSEKPVLPGDGLVAAKKD